MSTPPLNSHSNESFRDPAGFIFKYKGVLYRQINHEGKADFDFFISSGLYDRLASRGLLVSHKEVNALAGLSRDKRRYKIIQPERVPFVSYPYEWSFSQLKDAALLTLKLQREALAHGMILKDASAYNVQFTGQKPVFIDTLSFRIYEEGAPWDGYKQFCEHFIAPLALVSYGTPEFLAVLRAYIDGFPLRDAVKLLPASARLKKGLLAHVYLHAASQKRYEDVTKPKKPSRKVSRLAMDGLLASLEKTIRKLKLPPQKTEWSHYYSDTNYTSKAFANKAKIVESMLKSISPKPGIVWDLGANDGTFSELAANRGITTVSFDVDPLAVDQNYNKKRSEKTAKSILPLVQDLTNPSPALGWSHEERSSLISRGPSDVVLALALVHHLAIGNNSPLPSIAQFFSKISKNLIIEFIPRNDSKVKMMLAGRANMFKDYTPGNFETAFGTYFKLIKQKPVTGSERVIYLYQNKR